MELRHFKVILRWIWLLMLFPIISVIAGFAFLQFKSTIYEARSVLIVGPGIDSPNPDLNALRAGALLMQTYAELPRTDAFRERIIEELDLSLTKSELDDILILRQLVDTQILQIIVQDEDSERAILIANAIAEELVRLGPSSEQSDFLFDRIRQQASNIEQGILNIEERIATNRDQLEIETDSVNRALLTQQIAEDENRLSEANNTLADLYGVLQVPLTNRIEIIDLAEETIPLSSETALTMVVAAAAGITVSGLTALGLIVLNEQVIDIENLNHNKDLPLWAIIRPTKMKSQLPTRTAPDTDDARQYYQLGTQLLYQRDADSIYSVLFTSLGEPDYVHEIVSNLAIAIANTQNSVFLLDVDFRKNKLIDIFELENIIQLSDILQEDSSMDVAIADVPPSPHLKVLPSGTITSDHAFHVLSSPRMSDILRLLKRTTQRRRLLLMTAPPLDQMQNGLTLLSQLDMIVLVVNNRKITYSQLHQAIDNLKAVGANVGGIVMVNAKARF